MSNTQLESNSLKGQLLVLASALCFGSYGVWSRMLGNDFGIYYQGYVRSLLILIVLLPVALATKSLKPLKRADVGWFSVAMAFTVFTQVPLYIAFNHLALGTASLIFYSVFLITSYLFGWLFMRERMTLVKVVSLVLALVGLFATFGLSLGMFSIIALLLAAISGVASGGEVATSKKSSQTYSSLQIATYSWIFIFITHLPLSLLNHEVQIIPAVNIEWLAMVGYAATGLAGFWLVIEGFKHIDASVGGLIGLLEIIFSLVFGVLFFGDRITISVVIGGILIIGAAMLPDVYSLAKSRKTKQTPVMVR
jgi:drug/metabolite transporter (DMT)-like permease